MIGCKCQGSHSTTSFVGLVIAPRRASNEERENAEIIMVMVWKQEIHKGMTENIRGIEDSDFEVLLSNLSLDQHRRSRTLVAIPSPICQHLTDYLKSWTVHP